MELGPDDSPSSLYDRSPPMKPMSAVSRLILDSAELHALLLAHPPAPPAVQAPMPPPDDPLAPLPPYVEAPIQLNPVQPNSALPIGPHAELSVSAHAQQSPLVPPSHSMVTRSKSGIFKPR